VVAEICSTAIWQPRGGSKNAADEYDAVGADANAVYNNPDAFYGHYSVR
jgi:hypothetical protein